MVTTVKKRVYLVRHGETKGNRTWRHQAKSTPLTARGLRQAQTIAIELGAFPIDLVITSGATRTQQTALPLIEKVHCPIISSPLFEELRRPSSLIGKRYFNPYALWTIIMVYLHSGNDKWHHTDEETVPEFRSRIKDATALLETQKSEVIVVVSHRVFISSMLINISGRDIGGIVAFFKVALRLRKIANGSITELSYDPSRRKRWTVIRANDTRHLRGL